MTTHSALLVAAYFLACFALIGGFSENGFYSMRERWREWRLMREKAARVRNAQKRPK